jgi:hypothetical protein
MTRDVVFGIGVLSLALLACGGPKPQPEPEPSGGSDIVRIIHKDMGEKAMNFQNNFASASQKHGCKVNADNDSVIASCSGHIIAVVRDGTTINVGCKGMTTDQCNDLFIAIADELK